MNPKLFLCLALVASGGLFGCSITARQHAEHVSAPDIKMAFAKRPVAPACDLPKEALYPPDGDSNEHGALTNIVAGRISALTVTWADPKIFKTQSQTQDFLRELLSSTNTQTWAYHVWSFGDGSPSVVATVEHMTGRQGKWWVWCSPSPGLYWAYLDGNGKWWWGGWNSRSPKPKSLETGIKP